MTVILVTECDRPLLEKHHWHVDSLGYAVSTVEGKRIRLHRLVTNAAPGQIVDHINRDKLDCRRENLRLTDRTGNARNSKFRAHNTSGYRGVHKCCSTGRWRAEIRVNGKGKKLGRFDVLEDAARAYDAAAIKFHGEFAVLNFTTPGDKGQTGRGCGG